MSNPQLERVIAGGAQEKELAAFFSQFDCFRGETQKLTGFDDGRFSAFTILGSLNFGPVEQLLIVSARVEGPLSERSGKKAQYEAAKKILKTQLRYEAGIFIFRGDKGQFRFSLVYTQPQGKKIDFSNFRRFTYFVSPEMTNNTFRARIGLKCSFASLDGVKDAFSVEAVTEAFYKEIADWYFWAVKNTVFPKDAELEPKGRNNAAIRLITRMIFIWFMKERGLVSQTLFNPEKVASLLKSMAPAETTYYKAILQNLFFATLNTRMENRKFRFDKRYNKGWNQDYMDHGIYRYEGYFKNQEDMLAIFKDIPFLNGGLFDCLDWPAKESGTGAEVRFDGFTDKEVGLKLPNFLFFAPETLADLNEEYGTKNKQFKVKGLLNILSAYNFTIDENEPADQEVALDPELLGKVFENLLASYNPETATTARKATGSYYTPREVVNFMVNQSLLQYFQSNLPEIEGGEDKLRALITAGAQEDYSSPFNEYETRQIVRLTEDLRIVDPAVGSGAFPMGILNKLVQVLSRLDPANELWLEAQLSAVERLTDPILRNQVQEQIRKQFSGKSSNYGRKLYLIQKCIYGVDIQQIAIEIAKLRFFISLLVDESIDKAKPNWGIEPLPNLDFKLMQGNSLISEFMGIDLDAGVEQTSQKLIKDETDELIISFQEKKSRYQNEPDRSKKQALKGEIETLIIRIFESKLRGQKAEYFAKFQAIRQKHAHVPNATQREASIQEQTAILNKNYGFDLAAAEKQLKEFTTGQKVKPFFAWKLYFAEVFQEKGGFDIVIGNPPYIQLQKDGGKLADQYKTCKYCSFERTGDIYALFYEKGIDILRAGGHLCYITSNKWMRAAYGESLRRYFLTKNPRLLVDLGPEVFEHATVDTNILLVQNAANTYGLYALTLKPDAKDQDLGEYVAARAALLPPLTKKTWFIGGDAEQHLKGKIEKNGKPLKEWDIKINRGVITGLNEAFIVDNATKERLCREDPRSIDIMKPLLRGKDIKRYGFDWAGWWLIQSGFDLDIPGSYPAIHKHLRQFEARAKVRDDQGKNWWNLRACAYYSEFEKEKIVWGNLALSSQYSLVDKGFYINAPSPLITPGDKYLLGVLNSRLSDYYIRSLGVTRSGGYFEYKPMFIEQLPVPTANSQNKNTIEQIESLVARITVARKQNLKGDTQADESEIDELVYQLYDLTPEEIAIVEANCPEDK